jgi:hypothetical protein
MRPLSSFIGMAALFATLPAHAGPLDDGWYLWLTGRTDAAAEKASEALAAAPDELGAHQLAIAAGVDQGRGPLLESHHRDLWADNPTDPHGRVRLAMVLEARNGDAGSWCNEFERLLDGLEPDRATDHHYWATKLRHRAHHRCPGNTEHDGNELRMLAMKSDFAATEGAVDRLNGGYAKMDLPDDLTAVLKADPLALRLMEGAWVKGLDGPAAPGVRAAVGKAMKAALASDEPARVFAAIEAYTDRDNEKKADEARAHLLSLDPDAALDVSRTLDTLADPPSIAAIADALGARDLEQAEKDLAAIAAQMDPEDKPLAFAVHSSIAAVATAQGKGEAAAEARREAWLAHKPDRNAAERFARSAVPRGEHAELALEAIEVALAGREIDALDPGEGEIALRRKSRWIALQQLRGDAHMTQGAPELALAGYTDLLYLAPSPAVHRDLGRAYAAAGDGPAAMLHLAIALAELDDAALRTELTGLVEAAEMQASVAAITIEASTVDAEGAMGHPGVGEPAAWAQLLVGLTEEQIEAPEDDEQAELTVHMLHLWASWSAPSLDLRRGLMMAGDDEFTEDHLTLHLRSVDGREAHAERFLGDDEVPDQWAGAEILQTTGVFAVPSTLLVRSDGVLLEVVRGYGGEEDERLGTALRDAFDAIKAEAEAED